MGYGYGPGMGKPTKKPSQQKQTAKKPVQQKEEVPKKKTPKMPPLPFNLQKYFENMWK